MQLHLSSNLTLELMLLTIGNDKSSLEVLDPRHELGDLTLLKLAATSTDLNNLPLLRVRRGKHGCTSALLN